MFYNWEIYIYIHIYCILADWNLRRAARGPFHGAPARCISLRELVMCGGSTCCIDRVERLVDMGPAPLWTYLNRNQRYTYNNNTNIKHALSKILNSTGKSSGDLSARSFILYSLLSRVRDRRLPNTGAARSERDGDHCYLTKSTFIALMIRKKNPLW